MYYSLAENSSTNAPTFLCTRDAYVGYRLYSLSQLPLEKEDEKNLQETKISSWRPPASSSSLLTDMQQDKIEARTHSILMIRRSAQDIRPTFFLQPSLLLSYLTPKLVHRTMVKIGQNHSYHRMVKITLIIVCAIDKTIRSSTHHCRHSIIMVYSHHTGCVNWSC